MKTEIRKFDVSIPTSDGNSVAELVPIQIPMEWDEELGEWLMTEEGIKKAEETKARHMGLLLPSEIKVLRNRLELTQKQIGELLQIGEKTWTRWETGNARPSRSINLLLQALYDRELSLEYLQQKNSNKQCWQKIISFPMKKQPIKMDQFLNGKQIQTGIQKAS